ncbi:nicotinate-nucleotide--dimethylbenzimidazole phosphoribosyltransferase [Parendozoicomonas sp. Alg238-R29]|uniref:nicotinate-nucleotide--dimethylbenzimidazole phosphoribosyltransferase n=1 Tax=Parendozoicomonas sp. Alg238-R29 TaxID=2993446 RepID=UPI00248D4604|nr:nicotinate-nucleotide--dimethylbenzimidazole phosphoribosyltransferase [Parendozoicomonas sp. Alg238-R29]
MDKVLFLTTSGCHLCEQAWGVMERLPLLSPVEIEIVDIADDDALIEEYGEQIPVILSEADQKELVWPFSLADLRLFFEGLPGNLPLNWLTQSCQTINKSAIKAAHARQQQLTKPAGSLGILEPLVEVLAGQQGREKPSLNNVAITIFTGDHGVVNQGVSAYPAEVTTQMVGNFVNGGAAISVLAKEQNCHLSILDMGTSQSPLGWPGVHDFSAGQGTADFTEQPALTKSQLDWCLAAGAAHIDSLLNDELDLFIAGEMGIGNTTAAAAICCALTGLPAEYLAGRGTGLNDAGLIRKQNIINKALDKYSESLKQPLEALRYLGGFEIAAIVGAVIRCAQRGVPVLVDGFIVTAAALVACRLLPAVREWLLFAHKSAEPGHQLIMEYLEVEPLCDFGMRLGEASGAAVVLPLLRMTCELHSQMHTFAEAGVATSGE